ncbi:MAG TPA: hypothetical protein PLA50_03580 [Bacteroidia bacterium]|nr:hypothetical protein [Bacteroidia bacterium]
MKHATPADYRKLLGTLKAGDTLQLAAGVYERGLPVSDCHGRADAWITIQGPDSGVAEIRQTQVANCVELRQCRFVALKRLSILGDGPDGIPGLAGISAKGGLENSVHHILIEDCIIGGWSTSQQAVGISTKTPTWDWTIRRNLIRDCGTGLYLGNSDGTSPFIRGVIEHNLVENPIGYCMEIKYQKPRPDLLDMPTEASRTVIRHNVFIKNDAPSPNGDRPNVLVGGFPEGGPGSEDLYEIHGNFFWHNPRESLLQASGRVSIHDNLFHGCPTHAAITLRDHDLPLRLAHVYNNTIHSAVCGIRIANPALESHALVGNAVFADEPLALHRSITRVEANLTGSIAEASGHLADPASLDFHPLPGCCEGPPLDLSAFQSDAAFDVDFDGTAKGDLCFRGAYVGPAKAGSWRPQRGMKP